MVLKILISLIVFLLFTSLTNAQCLIPSDETVPIIAREIRNLCFKLHFNDCRSLLDHIPEEWEIYKDKINNEWRRRNINCDICTPFDRFYRQITDSFSINMIPCCNFVPYEYIAEIDEEIYFIDYNFSKKIGYLYNKNGKGLCQIEQDKNYEQKYQFFCLYDYFQQKDVHYYAEDESFGKNTIWGGRSIIGNIYRNEDQLTIKDITPPHISEVDPTFKAEDTHIILKDIAKIEETGLDFVTKLNGQQVFDSNGFFLKHNFSLALDSLKLGKNDVEIFVYDLFGNPSEVRKFVVEVDFEQININGINFLIEPVVYNETDIDNLKWITEIINALKFLLSEKQKELLHVKISESQGCFPYALLRVVPFGLRSQINVPNICFESTGNWINQKKAVQDVVVHETAHLIYDNYEDFDEFFEKIFNLSLKLDIHHTFDPFILLRDCNYGAKCFPNAGHPWDSPTELHSSFFLIYYSNADEFLNLVNYLENPNEGNTFPIFKSIVNEMNDETKIEIRNIYIDMWEHIRDNRFDGQVFTSDGIDPFRRNS
jgi:hypothetical protein